MDVIGQIGLDHGRSIDAFVRGSSVSGKIEGVQSEAGQSLRQSRSQQMKGSTIVHPAVQTEHNGLCSVSVIVGGVRGLPLLVGQHHSIGTSKGVVGG